MQGERCVLCETVAAKWNEPASAEDPAAGAAQIVALSRRLEELEHDATSPEELYRQMLHMCAMCQEVVYDVHEGATRDAIKDRIRFRIGRLRQSLAA